LSLAHNNIGSVGARALADALMLNLSVVVLNLQGNSIGQDGGAAIGTMLRGNNALVSLHLGGCSIPVNALVFVLQAIINHPTLSSLNLDKPLLCNPQEVLCATQHLSQAVKMNTVLTEVSLNNWGLFDDHFTQLLPSLAHNGNITSLSLQGNKLTKAGGILLAKLISRRPDLSFLNLTGNHLDDEGAIALAAAMRGHSGMQRLLLGFNAIGERGLIALADALQLSPGLTHVLLWGNHFTPKAAAVFNKYRKRLDALEECDISLYIVDGEACICQRN
jgi:Ran GTPase-activating protein (RanGAP) involved in mRNA processing and transport